MAKQAMTWGKAAKLRKNAFARSGWTFLGWATGKNGTVAYKNTQAVTNLRADGKTTTLYAVWAKNAYKVAYNANGGSGTMAAQGMTYGKAANLRKNAFTRTGYTFAGWGKTADGAVAYKDAANVKNLRSDGGTVTLYAVWDAVPKTETRSTPVAVPYEWLDGRAAGILAANGGNYEAAAKAKAANGRTVWECYVAGLDPEDKAAEFKATASFENGEWTVVPDPDLNKGGAETNRIYTWEGAEVLGDEAVWGPTNAESRFFRVKVALPEE